MTFLIAKILLDMGKKQAVLRKVGLDESVVIFFTKRTKLLKNEVEYFTPNPFVQPHSKIPNRKRKEKARYLPCSQIYFLFFGLPLHFLQTIYI